MTTETITVVAGLGRSGSSLLMKMLHQGGMEVYCEPENINNSYETNKIMGLPDHFLWLEDCKGKAVKVLDPHRWRLPQAYEYKVLFASRNLKEQAKSQYKLLAALGAINPLYGSRKRNQLRKIERCLKDDRRVSLRRFLIMERCEAMEIHFENILSYPLTEAERIAQFLGRDLDVEKMASVVVERSPENYDGFLELTSY